MSKKELKAFVDAEQVRMEKERTDYYKEHDMKTFVTWEKGLTQFTLMPVIPRLQKGGSFGPKYVFRISAGEVDLDWGVNPRSPVYRQLIDKLAEAPVNGTLFRMGEDKATRYELEWVE